MNGVVYVEQQIGDGFVPAASLNNQAPGIARVNISDQVRVVVYTAEEARRYAAAFTEAAELLDGQAGGAS